MNPRLLIAAWLGFFAGRCGRLCNRFKLGGDGDTYAAGIAPVVDGAGKQHNGQCGAHAHHLLVYRERIVWLGLGGSLLANLRYYGTFFIGIRLRSLGPCHNPDSICAAGGRCVAPSVYVTRRVRRCVVDAVARQWGCGVFRAPRAG